MFKTTFVVCPPPDALDHGFWPPSNRLKKLDQIPVNIGKDRGRGREAQEKRASSQERFIIRPMKLIAKHRREYWCQPALPARPFQERVR
jgi:hypothetical protein